jgi:hypothetical protein
MKIDLGGFKPPGARQKPSPIAAKSPKPSVVDDEDDDQPVQKNEPAPSTMKKLPILDSGSDDDELFNNTKKEKPNTEKANGKSNVTDLSVKKSKSNFF